MIYPDEFVRAVKAEFPNFERLHTALDVGSVMVGRYLDDNQISISAQEILNAPDLEAIQERARAAIVRERLYEQWCGLYEQTIEPAGGRGQA